MQNFREVASIPPLNGCPEGDQVSVVVARFPQRRWEDPHVCDWVINTVLKMKEDPRIKDVYRITIDDTPITLSRNRCVKEAMEAKADFILMVDSDMSPDCRLPENENTNWNDPEARPFWDTSFDFAYRKRLDGKPCVIGAPYCGSPPHENIFVFYWQLLESDTPKDSPAGLTLEQYKRQHAAILKGIQRCAALPTGVILIDTKCLKDIDKPYFYYEYADEGADQKGSTEDVTFTRDLNLYGFEQYCNWDAWAGHWKWKLVGKPEFVEASMFREKMHNAFHRKYGIGPGEQLFEAKNGKVIPFQSRLPEPAFGK